MRVQRGFGYGIVVLAAGGLGLILSQGAGQATQTFTRDQVLHGRYLVTTMGCADCHGGADPAAPNWLSGYSAKDNPDSKFVVGPITAYPKNLTPDPDTGLGKWTAQQIFTALRTGKDDSGQLLCPPMPWPAYRNLSDDDTWAIVAYLRSLKPVSNAVPEIEGPGVAKGTHPDCSMFYQGMQPLSPYPAANELEVK